MIGYNGSNRINPLKNRWPAIERGIIKIANQLEWRDRLTYLAFHAKVYEIMNGESADDAIDTTFEILLRNIFAGLFIGDTNRNVKMQICRFNKFIRIR
jgi:hypothetical protein